MGRKKSSPSPGGEGILTDLFEKQKRRAYTLSVDEETYEKITRVADHLGISRPKVLTTFVRQAYENFVEEAHKAGLDFDPDEPLSGNHKWHRNNGSKKRKKR